MVSYRAVWNPVFDGMCGRLLYDFDVMSIAN